MIREEIRRFRTPSGRPIATSVPAPIVVLPTPVTQLSTVDVISKPPGADFYVDRRQVGRTPVRVRDLSPGVHAFDVRKEGHVPYRRTFEIEPRSSYEMKVTLAAVLNSLRIVSNPPGAQVTVNGVARGVTPLLLDRLASGLYEVTVRLDEQRVQTKRVRLQNGELAVASFDFITEE